MHGVVNIAFLALTHFGRLQMNCCILQEDTVLVTLNELNHEGPVRPICILRRLRISENKLLA